MIVLVFGVDKCFEVCVLNFIDIVSVFGFCENILEEYLNEWESWECRY